MSSIINAVSGGSGGVSVTGDTSGQLVLQTAGTTAVTVNSSQQTTFANTINTPNTFGFKNRIINGAMVIDQRNAGASVTITNTTANTYTLDRWFAYGTVASKFSVQQNAGCGTPPVGFQTYLGATSLSAYSIGSGDILFFGQKIEGFNYADLGWGTASAKTVTLSFQVYSSLTGTFGGSLQNGTNVYAYPFSYSIPVANTWTTISITIAGPTAGTWVGATNGSGMQINFGLGVGSTFSGTAGSWAFNSYYSATGATSVVGTSGATFYVTGVQLEVGTQATSFDYRPYGTELALCQRYLPAWNNAGAGGVYGALGSCYYYSTTNAGWVLTLPVTARVPPTGISFSAVGDFQVDAVSSNRVTGLVISSTSQYVLGLNSTDAGSNTAGWGGRPRWQNTLTGQLLATGCEL
jgi:hypothetical protein